MRRYFNPRPPWGGRQSTKDTVIDTVGISIHALRGEGDVAQKWTEVITMRISIHALRGEGDGVAAYQLALLFISIHALRGEGD